MQGSDSKFFLHLSYGTLSKSLSLFQAATRTVDLTRPQSTLFSDQEDPIALNDKDKCGWVNRPPTCPIDVPNPTYSHNTPF